MTDNILDLGNFKLTRKSRYTRDRKCQHRHLVIDDIGETVECEDCGMQISPFWALVYYSENLKGYIRDFNSERSKLKEQAAKQVVHNAALNIQTKWRKRKTIPSCPHCHRGIFPQDRLGTISKDVENRHRQVDIDRINKDTHDL